MILLNTCKYYVDLLRSRPYAKIAVNRKTWNPPTFKHGLSVCAPMILNPFPGLNFPPTAKAIMVEWFRVKKH